MSVFSSFNERLFNLPKASTGLKTLWVLDFDWTLEEEGCRPVFRLVDNYSNLESIKMHNTAKFRTIGFFTFPRPIKILNHIFEEEAIGGHSIFRKNLRELSLVNASDYAFAGLIHNATIIHQKHGEVIKLEKLSISRDLAGQ